MGLLLYVYICMDVYNIYKKLKCKDNNSELSLLTVVVTAVFFYSEFRFLFFWRVISGRYLGEEKKKASKNYNVKRIYTHAQIYYARIFEHKCVCWQLSVGAWLNAKRGRFFRRITIISKSYSRVMQNVNAARVMALESESLFRLDFALGKYNL